MHIQKSSWLKHWDFIVLDLLCLNVTFMIAYWLRLGFGNMYAEPEYRMMVVIMMILHFCIAFFSDFYSGILSRGYFVEFKLVVAHNIVLMALAFAYLFVTQNSGNFSRTILVGFLFLNIFAMYLTHIVLKKIRYATGKVTNSTVQLMLLADEKDAAEAIKKITDGPDKTRQIMGIALRKEDTNVSEINGIPVVSRGSEIYEYVCRNVVDGVLICLDMTNTPEIERITKKFLQMGITVYLEMNMFSDGLPNAHFGHINDMSVLTTSTKTVSLYELFLKRTLDIAAGIVGCLITAILYIFVAPAIKIADPKGPVFFGQERAGRCGRTFKIYKFRSMYSDAEERKKEYMDKNKMDGLMFKLDNDPRIIGSGPDGSRKGLGHFLRSTSIDEFPNFWSILKGDMSLVGTRPPTMDEYQKYELHHKSRLATKPGLTGMWQVSGRSDFTDFEEVVKLDNKYIENWSFGLDIRIILKTIIVVLGKKGSQ